MANSPADILAAMQNGVIAINNLLQLLNTVSTTSSGVITIRLTQVST
jgi:hypothetical protein